MRTQFPEAAGLWLYNPRDETQDPAGAADDDVGGGVARTGFQSFKVSKFQRGQVGTSAHATSAPAADLPGTPVADPKAVLAKARAAAGMITAEDAEAAPRAQRKSGQQELLAARS